jgi:RNA polymerase sigma-70 factor (ECF subfamily)
MNGKNLLDRMAFSKLYEAYAPMVYRRCVFLLKVDAEAKDMVQNVFLRIYERMDTLDLSQPSSLLWNTATRLCLNRIRDKKRRGLDVDSSELLLTIACAEEDDGIEARGLLAKIFSKEQESTRTIATLHYVDGMTLEETAETVGLSVSGVRKRLRTLQAKIKNLEVER